MPVEDLGASVRTVGRTEVVCGGQGVPVAGPLAHRSF
ncbi:hypothetical protein SMD44_02534 [Streptomyces alboflavus]|uniref:Uncharacterized protein n=1 Tax=Streptomyces alboflavus TaxID=67267 RepID=A0A1Z1W9R8_9ACTN|nr:hypothetical protein SMD44_02534 [Streptomyces alboflavus]